MTVSEATHGYRRLTLILSILVFISSTITACLFHRLPDDPLHLAAHISFYSWFASILSVLGIIGAHKKNATLVAIFANYLMIDVLIAAAPRMLAIFWFPEIRGSVCSVDSINAWLQAQQAVSGLVIEPVQSQAAAEAEMQAQCVRVVGVLQVLVGFFAVGGTALQVILALRVSRYSNFLQKREAMREQQYREAAKSFGMGTMKQYCDAEDDSRDVKVTHG